MFQSVSDSAFMYYDKAEKAYTDLKDKVNRRNNNKGFTVSELRF
jgi:hypothetical protein